MTHLALRNTKRGKHQTVSNSTLGTELAAIFIVLFEILLNWYRWIKFSFTIPHLVNHRRNEQLPEISQSEEDDEFDDYEPGTLVVARGIGLMAAYTGRRAMFAIYPASGEGLEVSSRGPAPIRFDYKKKDDLFLVGYVPPAAGKYQLRVARFGRKAVGSPYLLRVDDPPPGYIGSFGASLWYERPPPPPLLSGIVDFVTEKMFLTEDGRLLKLDKNGRIMKPVEDYKQMSIQPHRAKAEKDHENKMKELKIIDSPPPVEEAPSPPVNKEIKKSFAIKKQVMSRIENIISTINNDNKKDPQEKYKYVSKALIKELSLSLKLLNMLGSSQELFNPSTEDITDSDEKQHYLVPETLVSEDSDVVGATDGINQSDPDRFLAERVESHYNAQRAGKLAWHWGDGAVVSEACDAGRQIETAVGPSGRREGLIGSLLQGGRNSRPWRKYGVSGLLGIRKNQDPTGIQLLHNIYRPEDDAYSIDRQKDYTNFPYLNNQSAPTAERQNNINVRSERNNLDTERINNSIKNHCKKDVLFKTEYTRNASNCRGKLNKWKTRDLKSNGAFRTLSLPDFNRILSLSVQGLRKAKSCGDRSFRAMSSNSFSVSLKNLFDREQMYNISGSHKQNSSRQLRHNDGTTLVKMTHYGSDRDSRNMLPGMKSVHEWRHYWEEKQTDNSDTEFGKGCSLELTGIVDRGKAIFESSSEISIPDIKIFDESIDEKIPHKEKNHLECVMELQNSFSRYSDLQKSPTVLSNSPVSNKTAFQKAKDMFEGNYNPKETNEEKDNRKKSISERFHFSSLSSDIQSGPTPILLGVPNRLPAVASLGSVYQSQYPHIPISPSRTRHYPSQVDQQVFPAWDIILNSDPNYV